MDPYHLSLYATLTSLDRLSSRYYHRSLDLLTKLQLKATRANVRECLSAICLPLRSWDTSRRENSQHTYISDETVYALRNPRRAYRFDGQRIFYSLLLHPLVIRHPSPSFSSPPRASLSRTLPTKLRSICCVTYPPSSPAPSPTSHRLHPATHFSDTRALRSTLSLSTLPTPTPSMWTSAACDVTQGRAPFIGSHAASPGRNDGKKRNRAKRKEPRAAARRRHTDVIDVHSCVYR